MKKGIIYLLLTVFTGTVSAQNSSLEGTWRLIEIISEGTSITPKQKFVLTLKEGRAAYNLEVNGCNSQNVNITEKEIFLDKVQCTMACCDGEFSNQINYSGSYELDGDTLRIRNDREFVLVKE